MTRLTRHAVLRRSLLLALACFSLGYVPIHRLRRTRLLSPLRLASSSYNLSLAVSSVNLQNFSFFYLQNSLKISERALMRIVLKYGYVLYLRPERTIIPTIEVFQSFGFNQEDIRTMVMLCSSS